MEFCVSRTGSRNPTHNVLVLRRPVLAHISALLKSNSGAVPLANKEYRLFVHSGQIREGCTDEDGLITESLLPPGDYEVQIEGTNSRFLVPTTPVHVCRRPIRLPGYILFDPGEESEDYDLPSDFDGDEEHVNPFDEQEVDDLDWEDVEEFIVGEEADA